MIIQHPATTSERSMDSDVSPTARNYPMRKVDRVPGYRVGHVDQEAHHPVELVTSDATSMVAPPPDGGFWAWMSVVSGFFAIMNTW